MLFLLCVMQPRSCKVSEPSCAVRSDHLQRTNTPYCEASKYLSDRDSCKTSISCNDPFSSASDHKHLDRKIFAASGVQRMFCTFFGVVIIDGDSMVRHSLKPIPTYETLSFVLPFFSSIYKERTLFIWYSVPT